MLYAIILSCVERVREVLKNFTSIGRKERSSIFFSIIFVSRILFVIYRDCLWFIYLFLRSIIRVLIINYT